MHGRMARVILAEYQRNLLFGDIATECWAPDVLGMEDFPELGELSKPSKVGCFADELEFEVQRLEAVTSKYVFSSKTCIEHSF